MLQRLLLSGLVSGLVAGVVVTLVHLIFVTPLILEAETYETGGAAAAMAMHAHPGGLRHAHAGGDRAHEHGAQTARAHLHENGLSHSHAGGNILHRHEAEADGQGDAAPAWAPADGLERALYTLASNLVAAVAYGLLLAAALTLYGKPVTLVRGLAWGAAGFFSFSLAPALGLPPELPGAAAVDLVSRQVWWLSTAFASCLGLAAIAFARAWVWRIGGLALLLAPHIVGAPQPDSGLVGLAPPELASHFAVLSLFTGAVLWAVVGGLGARFFNRARGDGDQALNAVKTP